MTSLTVTVGKAQLVEGTGSQKTCLLDRTLPVEKEDDSDTRKKRASPDQVA